MKVRFSTLDLFAVVHDLRPLIGMRVVNVYDIDSRTYLLKLQKPEQKAVILFESGIRIHPTNYDWPKAAFPSGFSMKLRKHIRQKRLINVTQFGIDRIVDLQLGEQDRACHVIIELYDRGNVILTDDKYTILNILRPRTDKDDVRFAVREKYPIELARQLNDPPSMDHLKKLMDYSEKDELLRKRLGSRLQYSPVLVEHCLMSAGFPSNIQLSNCKSDDQLSNIHQAIVEANRIFVDLLLNRRNNGYLMSRMEDDSRGNVVETNQEFQPFPFVQMTRSGLKIREFATFANAIDEFYSKKETQKLDLKAVHQKRDAYRKLENVRNDHAKRLEALDDEQRESDRKAALIEVNEQLVDKAITVVRTAVARQLSWEQIEELVGEAAKRLDPVASRIDHLDLDNNRIILRLRDPYSDDADEAEDADEEMAVSVDLGLNAFQNARQLYDQRRAAVAKQQRTVDASKKALKSAEVRTKNLLKLMQVCTTVSKHRKPMWFEKFLWFISSENYLVIAGRDAQQNELIVKRHFNQGDVYVHADVRGATSVIIKNRPGCTVENIPPKTLIEAGSMAVCYSMAWETKLVVGAWWVEHEQVSRTAPSGEYLTLGSFMIRGRKNFLLPEQLQIGFGFLFKLDEDSMGRHKGERQKPTTILNEEEDEEDQAILSSCSDSDETAPSFPDVRVDLNHLTVGKSDIDDYTILQVGPERRNVQKKYPINILDQSTGKTVEKEPGATPKRGQKHKQLKLKGKYKDQDEEERQLRMDVLKSGGIQKVSKKVLRKSAKVNKGRLTISSGQTKFEPQKMTESVENEAMLAENEHILSEIGIIHPVEKDGKIEEVTKQEDDDAEEEEKGDSELGVIDTLTAIPLIEDTLLFVVPVCAPYQTMASYKYKVKLTPGTGKRTKAIKTALAVFQKDKSMTNRERDLIRTSGQDPQLLARNIPGKVRVSAPQLNAFKQR